MSLVRRYSELRQLATFDERFAYLRLAGVVGASTFGFDRYLNQILYHDSAWKSARNAVIIRDNGCDLGIPGFEIYDRIIVHHMNPLTVEMINARDPAVFDPEFLITVSDRTHNAIHYGVADRLETGFTERKPGDTCPWR